MLFEVLRIGNNIEYHIKVFFTFFYYFNFISHVEYECFKFFFISSLPHSHFGVKLSIQLSLKTD